MKNQEYDYYLINFKGRKMTSRERIINTLKGEKVDRAPIWLRDQWNLAPPFRKEETLDVVMADEFADGWVLKDDNFKKVVDYYKNLGGDIIKEFIIPNKICNRLLCTPPSLIKNTSTIYEGKNKIFTYEIDTPKGKLQMRTGIEKNVSTMWNLEYLIKNESDIEKLISIPFELEAIDFDQFRKEDSVLGENGVHLIQIDTPFITVSGLMKFEEFLMMCGLDHEILRKLCDIAFERIMQILEACLKNGMGPLYRINGSEQATPPMNSPKIYKEFVYPYEKQMISKIHEYGCFAAVHSHGKIRENLPLMVDMELDMLDPIEAPPSGDISFTEALELSRRKITLAGNIQFSDLEALTPDEIESQVKEIFTTGRKDHIILNSTGSPITYMSEKLKDNYITMINAGMKYGQF